jgi:hypothetical protein
LILTGANGISGNRMPTFFCVTCGTHYPPGDQPPLECPICLDERQYVPPAGQGWKTLEELQAEYKNIVVALEPNLDAISTVPTVAIGQRAYLIQTTHGNVLWDCISLIDDATVQAVNERGGLTAIALSHPHFHSGMIAWSHAFGGIPIYVHAANAEWVQYPDPSVHLWRGETLPLNHEITLIRCGGHFDGSTALHWSRGAEGTGALFTADTLSVKADRKGVTFMHSFPNSLPLNAAKVRAIGATVEPFAFDRIYGGWQDRVIAEGGKAVVSDSVRRYIELIT